MAESFREYCQIKEASEILGVSPGTLRNWSRDGRLPEYRHPVNGYRLFRRSDLEALLAAVVPSRKGATPGRPSHHPAATSLRRRGA